MNNFLIYNRFRKVMKEQGIPFQEFPLFDLSNISDSMMSVEVDWDNFQTSFPTPVPPYERMWFEWIQRSISFDDAMRILPKNVLSDVRKSVLSTILSLPNNRTPEQRYAVACARLDKGDHWEVTLTVLGFTPEERLGADAIGFNLLLQKDGKFIHWEDRITMRDPKQTPDDDQLLLENSVFSIPLFALSLLNCKNIIQIEYGGKPKGKRSPHKQTSYKYHVLTTRPIKRTYINEREEVDDALKASPTRFHFVRGHFKTYTLEAPLFGNITGTFWWQEHGRGSLDAGLIDKDYNVLPE